MRTLVSTFKTPWLLLCLENISSFSLRKNSENCSQSIKYHWIMTNKLILWYYYCAIFDCFIDNYDENVRFNSVGEIHRMCIHTILFPFWIFYKIAFSEFQSIPIINVAKFNKHAWLSRDVLIWIEAPNAFRCEANAAGWMIKPPLKLIGLKGLNCA